MTGAANPSEEPSPPSDAVTEQAVSVRLQDGLLSLYATQVPWNEVLHEIQEKTGMRFHHVSALRGSVSVSITALPMQQGLEQLFGLEASFIFQYRAGAAAGSSSTPREVWVLGRVRERGAEVDEQAKLGLHNRALPPPEAQENRTMRADTEGDPADPALNDAEVISYLTTMLQDGDPATRVQALSALAQRRKGDEAELHIALDAALNDKHASVRGSALQILANRGGAEATGQLWQALRDPDPWVRIVAVESVGPGEEGQALLAEALADADETVRFMAAERLNARKAER